MLVFFDWDFGMSDKDWEKSTTYFTADFATVFIYNESNFPAEI